MHAPTPSHSLTAMPAVGETPWHPGQTCNFICACLPLYAELPTVEYRNRPTNGFFTPGPRSNNHASSPCQAFTMRGQVQPFELGPRQSIKISCRLLGLCCPSSVCQQFIHLKSFSSIQCCAPLSFFQIIRAVLQVFTPFVANFPYSNRPLSPLLSR